MSDLYDFDDFNDFNGYIRGYNCRCRLIPAGVDSDRLMAIDFVRNVWNGLQESYPGLEIKVVGGIRDFSEKESG